MATVAALAGADAMAPCVALDPGDASAGAGSTTSTTEALSVGRLCFLLASFPEAGSDGNFLGTRFSLREGTTSQTAAASSSAAAAGTVLHAGVALDESTIFTSTPGRSGFTFITLLVSTALEARSDSSSEACCVTLVCSTSSV